MPYQHLDDTFAEHPKVMDLSDRSFRLHVSALCYCSRNLTDGVLTERSVAVVCALTRGTQRHIRELVVAGLWEQRDEGYEIHDYLEYHQTANEIKKQREQSTARKRRWREKNRNADSGRFGTRDETRSGTRDETPPYPIHPYKEQEPVLLGRNSSERVKARVDESLKQASA